MANLRTDKVMRTTKPSPRLESLRDPHKALLVPDGRSVPTQVKLTSLELEQMLLLVDNNRAVLLRTQAIQHSKMLPATRKEAISKIRLQSSKEVYRCIQTVGARADIRLLPQRIPHSLSSQPMVLRE